MAIHEVPIETIYLDENASTHFRPVVDSARVYAPLAKFSLSSILAFGIDLAMVLTLDAITGDLLVSVVGARVVSSIVNFATNRRLVFGARRGRSVTASATRYFALVVAVLSANYGLLHLVHERLDVALLPAKLLTEAMLFTLSYQAQKHLVFGHDETTAAAVEPAGAARQAPSVAAPAAPASVESPAPR